MGTKDPFNLPEAEFDAVMTEIDQKLRRRLSDVRSPERRQPKNR
jgi:hypothetical protein